MKIIRIFGNTEGLALITAILMLFFSGHSTLIAKLDTLCFDLGVRLISKKEVPDKTTLIMLPISKVSELKKNSSLNLELIQFLRKLKDVKPAAAVFILDGYPQAIVNDALMQVEEGLEKVAALTEMEDNIEFTEILKLTKDMSAPGGELARTIKENNILVALKIGSQSFGRDSFGPGNFVLYEKMKHVDLPEKTFMEWLLASVQPNDTPVIDESIGFEIERSDYGKVIPLFFNNTGEKGWPLVWKYGDSFLPDLVALLYQNHAKSASPVWVVKKGVRFDYYLMHTDFSGRLYPLFLTSGRRDHGVKEFSLGDMAFSKNLNSLKNKIVLIGSREDPALRATALTLLSLSGESTSHTPVWAIWLEKGMILLFAVYLIFLLQRIQIGLGIVLSLFLAFITLTMQLGMLVTKGVWLPVTTAVVYLLAGLILMQFKFYTRIYISRLEAKKHGAFYKLGTHYFEKRQYNKAFESFKECTPNEKVFDSLYDIGLEYERRQKLKNACKVFEYIDSQQKDFRDAGKRAGQLIDFMEGRTGGDGSGDGSETIDMPTFELQRTVLGRYEIERELGRGAMGVVYLGRDPKIGRSVAIKTLDFADSENMEEDYDTERKRFFREAEAIGRLNHPNIVTVYDVGEEEDLAFIAMDYLTGKTLRFFADKNNLLPVPVVYELTIQVAEALAYAHSQNVIHRDIKPGNIMYNEEEKQVKVTDFGIARFMDTTITTTHAILGSPSFMAPEQLKGSKVDGKADIFSLGVTFFQLLTGQFPFGGSDLPSITYQITNEETPDVKEFRAGLPESAGEIICKALEKEPDKRFQTATEMADALRKGAPKKRGRKKK